MGKVLRKIQKYKDKNKDARIAQIISELKFDLTKPDELCNECIEPLKDGCYLTCKQLFLRNKVRVQSKVDELRKLTGDENIK